MVFDRQDFLVLEVILQGSAVQLLQYRVEFDSEDADQHILSFVTETEAISTVHGKPELPGICVPKVELGNEGKSCCSWHVSSLTQPGMVSIELLKSAMLMNWGECMV